MRPYPRILLLALLAAALPACGWFSDSGKPVLTTLPAVDLPGLQPVGLHQVWQRQLRLEPGERIRQTWRVENSVYVATTDSRLFRIDATTGILRWTNALGTENFQIYKPIELKSPEGVVTHTVLVVTGGEAFIFDLDLGDILAQVRLGISVSADPVVIGNMLCVGGADTFYGLYLDRLGKDSVVVKAWRIPVPGDLFVSAPLALDSNVIFGSRSGLLWRIDGATGDWEWKDRKTNGLILGGLTADYNAVYVPCEDQRVYAFRTDSGGEMWESQADNRLEDPPMLAGPVILAIDVNHTMYALARPTGDIKWKVNNVAQVATINEDTLWYGDTSGILHLIKLDTGEEKASAPTPGIQLYVRNTSDQNILLVTHAGLLGMFSPSTNKEKPAP